METKNILKTNTAKLSVKELHELERALSVELLKVQNGIINDSFAGYESTELKKELSNKILEVQNLITAKSLRT